jgi:non-ribosomal peptide synthetase component F
MIEDSRLRHLVADESLSDEVRVDDLDLVQLEASGKVVQGFDADCPTVPVGPDDLVYTIYTSGSTGKPKGVCVQHAAVHNFLESMRNSPGFTSGDSLLAVTTLSFDIAVLELYLPLIAGGTVVIASREVSMDGGMLKQLIEARRINVMQATPSTWRMLLTAGWKPQSDFKALCGGEAMPEEVAKGLAGQCELWNMYGPTETTVWSSCYRVPASGQPV